MSEDNWKSFEPVKRIDEKGYLYLGTTCMGWVAPKDRHLEKPPVWDKPESYYESGR